MASKSIYFVLLVVALSLVVEHADAGWKFWKKKKEDPTTVAPGVAGDPLVGAANPATGGAKPADGASPAAGGASPAAAGAKPAGGASPAAAGAKPAGGATPAAGGAKPASAVNPAPSSTGGNSNSRNSPAPGAPSTGTRGAIAGAANPGLAIGVGSTGENIRNNARPSRPNPGTEVGLDISGPRPARPGTGGTSGQGYRDWAADLTGAGEGSRQPPKVPSQGPALSAGGAGQQQPGSRPGSPTGGIGQQPGSRPGTPTSPAAGGVGQQQPGSRPGTPTNTHGQSPPALGPRPGSPTGGLPPQQGGQKPPGQGNSPVGKPNSQGTGASDGTHVSTLNIGSLRPGQTRPGSSSSGYGSPGSQPSSPTGGASPTGGKSWADVAGNGGNSRPGSPTPAPRPGSVQVLPAQPARPGQTTPAGRPTGMGRPAGQPTPGQTTGSGLGGRTGAAVAGGAAAGAIAAGAAAAGGKVYSANPTFSKGNTVTDEDLEKLAEALFIKDTNNANKYITVNLQRQTTGDSTVDQAPLPLLTVNPQALQIPTIDKVIKLYDNYKLDTRTNEYISPAQRQEESLLVDTFLSTNLMSYAMRFLADKGFVRKDYYEYKDTLRRLWFNLYSRGDGKIGSAGFEHVFLTELKLGTEVSGLHNWIYFNAEEVARRADYLGYIKKVDLGDKASIIKFHTKFNNIDKPVTTMFIGTSPELEMAIYTVCFFTREDRPCPLSMGGTKFNVKTHKFRYRGKDLIGSAYPEI